MVNTGWFLRRSWILVFIGIALHGAAGQAAAQAATPTPFRFPVVTPTPFRAPVTTTAPSTTTGVRTTTTTTTAPRAGGLPLELALPALAGGLAAIGGGSYLLRRRTHER